MWSDNHSKSFMKNLRDDAEKDVYMAWAIEGTTLKGLENVLAKPTAITPPTVQNDTTAPCR